MAARRRRRVPPGGRVLVLGASGYVGSRLVPALLAAGHEVVAASSSAPDPTRFGWGDRVELRRCDVTDPADVRAALARVDAVCYLVHSLAGRDFAARDRLGAATVAEEVGGSPVRRVVYLSGLVPTPGETPSAHLASRLEVERILATAPCSTLTLRAGVVVGAGSTSFEVIRALGRLLLLQPVPPWMRHRVQPVAATDAIRALVEALGTASPRAEGVLDLGGPDVLTYPELLSRYARTAGLLRAQLPLPAGPRLSVALATAALSPAPYWTVAALVDSMKHDLVCDPRRTWTPADGPPPLDLDTALHRAEHAPAGSPVAEAPLASDPDWTRMRAPLLDELGAPVSTRAAVSLGLARARTLARALLAP